MNKISYERSKNILIPQKSPTTKEAYEYSLQTSFFDPTKCSPPNEFMNKLKIRNLYYNSCNSLDSLDKE